MKILKNGIVVIHPDGHVTFNDFTIDGEGHAVDVKAMALLALDDAYRRALVALGATIIVDVSTADSVH